MIAILELLNKLPLFSGLPEPDLMTLVRQSRIEHFDREATLFEQGEVCDRIWIVQTGQVKIVYQETDGREVILELIDAGEAFGGAVLFLPRHPATAKAMDITDAVSFPSEMYAAFLGAHPPVSLRLIRMLGKRLHSMMDLQILAGQHVERRMAHILVKLADRVGRADPGGILITLALSRQDLADMAGTTLETAIRMMSHFRAQGLLETRSGGYLLITNIKRLRQQAGPG